MLPGKTYTPTDYLRMAWRRRWFIAVPALLIASTTAVVALFLPDRYRASTMVMIVPQRVPSDFVQSTVTNPLAERLDMISQQILSRTRLERIVQEFNLYPRERRTMIMEDVIEQMRKDIKLEVDADPRRRDRAANFRVGFESPEARTAMRVTERLGSLFVQENLEDRQLLADQTNQFLEAQLDEAKRRLLDHEKKLQDFRQRNNGQLPEQTQANLSMMQSGQLQLQNNIESQNRDRDRLQVLERTLGDLTQTASTTLPAAAPSGGDAGPSTAAQALEQAKALLRAMEVRYKPDYPDLKRQAKLVAELEAKAEAEALNQPLSAVTPAPVVVVDRNTMQRVESMKQDILELRQRIESSKREEARLRELLAIQETRVSVAPSLQAQVTELMRDYNTLQETYTSLLKRSQEAKLSKNMELRQIGEQFRIIDGARLPERPVSPDRVRINIMGIFGGLLVGLALAALLEYRDSSVKTDSEVMETLSLPVLAVIPLMTSAAERRYLRRRKLLIAGSASVACMLVAAAVMVVWRLQLVETWLRR